MDDLLGEREGESRAQLNWIDEEGEEFMRDYNMDLPMDSNREGPTLRRRGPTPTPSLVRPPSPSQPRNYGVKSNGGRKRASWSDDDLKQAIAILDGGYTMREVCEAFSIPRTSLRDYYNGRIKGRKMGPQGTFSKEEKAKLVEYMIEVVRVAHPLSTNDLKMKVVEIC